jgi:hypothetical protein
MAVATTDVPGKYDLVLNVAGTLNGYIFDRTRESTLYGSRARAEYTSSPTFVERQNISNAYGDNAQDFFLTARQRDWSLGEQQKYFRSGNDGRYWMGQNVDISTPGQVKLSQTAGAITFAQVVRGSAREAASHSVDVAGTTKLYEVAVDGNIADLGLHGLGTQPEKWAVCNDGNSVFLSSESGGSVGVRRYSAAAFTTFSATGATSLCFVNNTLYGFSQVSSALYRYDSAGVATTLFSWKAANGGVATVNYPRLHSFGGRILIPLLYAQESSELWIYDGNATSRLEVFPENFVISDCEVLYGVAYIAGSFMRAATTTTYNFRPAVMFFDGSQIGRLWEANDYNTVASSNIAGGPHPALGVNNGKLVFTDETTGNFMAYDPARGGVSSFATFTPNTGDSGTIGSTGLIFTHVRNQTGGYFFPSGVYPSSGYVISSLFDFDSSLNKTFRGVTVEFDAASDGNGGTVDVSYQLNSVAGSWTSLATGVTSGTETVFPANISGHSVAVKVTLNKGTSTSGPTLKRLNIRAVPTQQSYELRAYNLDLTSTPTAVTALNDGTPHPSSGFTQAVALRTAIKSTTPITVTDKFGTFTGVCEPAQCAVLEIHSEGTSPATPGQFVATLTVREV